MKEDKGKYGYIGTGDLLYIDSNPKPWSILQVGFINWSVGKEVRDIGMALVAVAAEETTSSARVRISFRWIISLRQRWILASLCCLSNLRKRISGS